MDGNFTDGIANAMFWALIGVVLAAIGGWELTKYLVHHIHVVWR